MHTGVAKRGHGGHLSTSRQKVVFPGELPQKISESTLLWCGQSIRSR